MRVLDVAVPLLLVAFAAAALFSTVRSREPLVLSWSRPYFWVFAGIWAMMAGDAALGENRPTFERTWKGAVALLVGVAFLVSLWLRRRPARPARGRQTRFEPALRGEPVDE